MSEYIFGSGSGHLPEAAYEIAYRYGARLVNSTEPNGEKRHWFSCKSTPCDQATRDLVLRDLREAGIRY